MHHITFYLLCTIAVCTHTYHKTTLLGFEPYGSVDEQMEQFLEPVIFTQRGFERFFTHQYNTRRYANTFLPCCFVHVLDFLAHARTTPDPHTFAIATFDLFHQRLKDVTWVNPYALLMLLEHLPDNLASLCHKPDQKQSYRSILHDAILYDFNTLKQDPDTFLDKTAEKLYQQDQHQQTRHDLQHRATRCIESALDKLIWSPNEQISTWHTCTAIGKQLETLYHNHIIPDETTLNHLLWSLIYRYGHFLEYGGAYMSVDTYTQIKQELDTQAPFLEYEELETYMTDKREYLLDMLSRGYAQSMARKQGIM